MNGSMEDNLNSRFLKQLSLFVMIVIMALGSTSHGTETSPDCRTALLVIDVQNQWASDPELHATIDGVFIVDRIAELIELANAHGIRVIYIRDITYEGQLPDEQLQYPATIAPGDDDWVVEKEYPDSFAFTTLGDLLEDAGMTQVLISGLASQGCVDGTIGGAIRRRYNVIVIADGHTGLKAGERAAEYNARWSARGTRVIPFMELDWLTLCLSWQKKSD